MTQLTITIQSQVTNFITLVSNYGNGTTVFGHTYTVLHIIWTKPKSKYEAKCNLLSFSPSLDDLSFLFIRECIKLMIQTVASTKSI